MSPLVRSLSQPVNIGVPPLNLQQSGPNAGRKWQLVLLSQTIESSEPQFSLQHESFYMNVKVLKNPYSICLSLKPFSVCSRLYELHVRSFLTLPALSISGNVEYLIPS